MADIDLTELRAAAEAATPGPWEAECSDETVEVNAGTALTRWNADRSVGRPASSWRSRDRILERDVSYLDEDEAEGFAADAEFIALANPSTVLTLLDMLAAAGVPGAAPQPAPSTEPVATDAGVDGHPDTCRHRCPECRMGLGSHLECDPQCEVRRRREKEQASG